MSYMNKQLNKESLMEYWYFSDQEKEMYGYKFNELAPYDIISNNYLSSISINGIYLFDDEQLDTLLNTKLHCIKYTKCYKCINYD